MGEEVEGRSEKERGWLSMKIRVTEIEANAEELKTCNTLSQNLNAMLTRAFAPHTGRSTYEYEDDDESGEDGEA